jgi:hypothetical protein
VTLAADPRGDTGLHRGGSPRGGSPRERAATGFVPDSRPVEFWPTSAIRAAVESGDLATWQRIATALKRDPFGRTARQVEEVLETASSYGISEALAEVLDRSRANLEADERAEVARQVKGMLERSGLGPPEFASRVGASSEELASYLDGTESPLASQMVRMRRLADRFSKIRAQRASRPE